MTDEMSWADLTPEEYPLHFAAAKECGGEVRPFDVYQGPYIYVPGKGHFWLIDNEGVGHWWSEHLDELSYDFFIDEGWADIAANALAELIAGEYATPVSLLTCSEDACRLAEIGEL